MIIELLQKTIRLTSYVLFTVCLLAFVGCTNGSGITGEENPIPITEPGDAGLVYSGPAPRDTIVANFKTSVWNNLAVETRCGACHFEGNEAPYFVRTDDINAAHDDTIAAGLVNFGAPVFSRMVVKVGGGCNCWESELVLLHISEPPGPF